MVECPIPQDILKYKSKFIMSLSVRETVFGGLGIGAGLLCFFSWTSGIESQDLRLLFSFLTILPFFLIGFVKLYDQPFEKIAPALVMENFIYPPKRRKEVHFPEFEKFEKTREWLMEKEEKDPDAQESKVAESALEILSTVAEEEAESGKKGKKSPNKTKSAKKAPQKVVVQKSETYKGIK